MDKVFRGNVPRDETRRKSFLGGGLNTNVETIGLQVLLALVAAVWLLVVKLATTRREPGVALAAQVVHGPALVTARRIRPQVETVAIASSRAPPGGERLREIRSQKRRLTR